MQPDSAHAFSSDVLWSPDDAQCRASGLSSYLQWLKTINGQNFDSYRDLWSWSVTDVAGFWASLDQFERLGLSQTSDAVLLEEKMPGARWFNGSHVNYARRVLDGGADVDADLALICLGEDDARREITRGRLRAEVASFAAALRGWGVKNGDRVVGYLANTEEAIIGVLGNRIDRRHLVGVFTGIRSGGRAQTASNSCSPRCYWASASTATGARSAIAAPSCERSSRACPVCSEW